LGNRDLVIAQNQTYARHLKSARMEDNLDMREHNDFQFTDNPYCMYDPVRRLVAGFEPGLREMGDFHSGTIGIHHDPEIEAGRYMMPQRPYSAEEREVRKKMGWDFDRLVPFRSSSKICLARISYRSEDCGDRIRLKIAHDASSFQSYHWRGSIEQLNIPLVSNDVSSMYVAVFKAYPGLPILRQEYPPERYPNAQAIEICVMTSALTSGLGLSVDDYPVAQHPKPNGLQSTGPRSSSGGEASMSDVEWHRLAIWPMKS
jgi:hypothetical protein